MSYSIILGEQELKDLKNQIKVQKDTKIYKRLLSLKMKDQGLSNQNISKILDVHIDTITDWFKIYTVSGLNGLLC
jgi:transposase